MVVGHPHTRQGSPPVVTTHTPASVVWPGGIIIHGEQGLKVIRVSHVESGGEHYINYDRSTVIN